MTNDPELDALRVDPFAFAAAVADATEEPTPAGPRGPAADWQATDDATLDRLLPAAIAGIDLDTMRQAAPVVRARLIDLLRDSVRQLREARGTVVVPEDTFDTVRRVTAAQEVMTQWAQAFTAAAQECTAILEEEALTANGGLPGYEEAPSGSLFVPDGQGQRIAVTPDWKPGTSTWDVDSLAGWIAEHTVTDEGRGSATPDEEDPVWTNEEAVSLCRDAIDKLRSLGTFTPGIKLIEAERKRLAGLGRDSDAAVLRQVRSVGLRQYRGVKVTREDVK